MEENAADSDSDHEDEPGDASPEEMAVVGAEDDEDGMVVMAVADGGDEMEDGGEADGGGEDDEVQQFDITLPATHSYLGSDLEQLGGRRVLEAGWTGRVPGVAHHGTVFPGETVPMLLPPEPLRETILQERLFCLLCPDESGSMVSGLGVLCEVLAGAAGAGVVARAAHRVRLRQPRTRAGHAFRRMQMLEVVVLPEMAPGDPLRLARLASLDPLRRPQEDTRSERTLRCMDAAGSPWPAFVWQLFDYRRLRARLTDHFTTLNLVNGAVLRHVRRRAVAPRAHVRHVQRRRARQLHQLRWLHARRGDGTNSARYAAGPAERRVLVVPRLPLARGAVRRVRHARGLEVRRHETQTPTGAVLRSVQERGGAARRHRRLRRRRRRPAMNADADPL